MDNDITNHTTDNTDNELFGGLYNPTGLYNGTIQEVLKGLLSGLALHHGRVDQVKREDILAGSNVSPVTLDQYFKDPAEILSEAKERLENVVHLTENNMDRFRTDAVIRILLENLSKEPATIKILVLMDDYHFWEKNLRIIIRYVAVCWRKLSDGWWNELFDVFCFQFHYVLKIWAEADFSKELLEMSVKSIMAWLEADAEYVFFAMTPRPEDAR